MFSVLSQKQKTAWARGSLIFTALLWGAGLYSRAGTQQWRRERLSPCPLVEMFGMWARKMSKTYCWWQRTKSAKETQRPIMGVKPCQGVWMTSCWQWQPENSMEDPLEGLKPGGKGFSQDSLASGALTASGVSLSPLNALLR